MKQKLRNILETARDERGFTLTELLIVVALIGIIMTFAATQIMGKFNKAKVDSTKIQMKNLGNILDQFRIDCGFYPSSEQGLEALISKPTGGRECKNYDEAGYVKGKKKPKDGWGNDFLYESDGSKYVLRSLGDDAVEGGAGLGADISSEDI